MDNITVLIIGIYGYRLITFEWIMSLLQTILNTSDTYLLQEADRSHQLGY